ncbi:MAG: triose-phosphate isomerase [Deltaproteobacteria bacterium]|jgi:triosephosphate isomerase|nr:triose-phosphate isomerase [Deltaproteobacteria bacterium]
MSRKPFLAGNWKMYKTSGEAVSFIEALKPLLLATDREVGLGVQAIALADAARAAQGSPILIGAQNIYFEKEGAYTGEVSGPMVKAGGASFVILGHSERRQFFGDTDAWVAKKLAAALESGLIPVVCLGESLTERESGKTFQVLGTQLKGSLAGLTPEKAQTLVLAYEPVWAIGTGKTASNTQAQEVHAFLRQELATLLGPEVSQNTRILYGGSVKPDNVKGLMAEPDIDGALVGGAALKPESFKQIINFDK